MRQRNQTLIPGTNTNKDTRFGTRLAFLIMALALVAVACGGSEDATATTAVSETTAAPQDRVIAGDDGAEPPAEPEPAEAVGDDGTGRGGVEPTVLPVGFNRDIIFTADLEIAVVDVAAAGEEATTRIQGLGGFLFGQQTTGGTNPRSVLIFKIIPEQFQTALDQLGGIGELRNQSVTADDVTQRVVNLESQIATSQASVERLRRLLESAPTLEDIAILERELLARETNLETLRGTLRTLREAVGLATITLRIEEARLQPSVQLIPSAYPGFEDEGSSCPGNEGGVTVDRGNAATICWEIRNTGDTDLTAFDLTDTVLDITLEDVTVVAGDPDALLRPGQSILVALRVDVDRRIRTQTRLSATPVNSDGARLDDRQVASTSALTMFAEDPGGVPGFGEGLSASWRVLIGFGQVLRLAVGIALPFLWIPVLLYALARWRRKREDAHVVRAGESPPPPGPPPPEIPENSVESERAMDTSGSEEPATGAESGNHGDDADGV